MGEASSYLSILVITHKFNITSKRTITNSVKRQSPSSDEYYEQLARILFEIILEIEKEKTFNKAIQDIRSEVPPQDSPKIPLAMKKTEEDILISLVRKQLKKDLKLKSTSATLPAEGKEYLNKDLMSSFILKISQEKLVRQYLTLVFAGAFCILIIGGIFGYILNKNTELLTITPALVPALYEIVKYYFSNSKKRKYASSQKTVENQNNAGVARRV